MLIVVSLYFFFLADRIHLRPGLPLQVGMGTLSGVMGGLFAMQGPPAVIYFISSSDTTEEYIAMTQWYFFVGNAMMTVYRSVDGLVTGSVLCHAAFAVPAVVLGIILGDKASGHIKLSLLRRLVYAFLAVSGVITLLV